MKQIAAACVRQSCTVYREIFSREKFAKGSNVKKFTRFIFVHASQF